MLDSSVLEGTEDADIKRLEFVHRMRRKKENDDIISSRVLNECSHLMRVMTIYNENNGAACLVASCHLRNKAFLEL